MRDTSQRGAKIGPRIAMLVSQAVVATHRALIGTKHKLAMAIFRAISDEISEEVDTTLGPILRDMQSRYDAGGPMASFLDFLANGHGQWKAIVGTASAASGILSSIAMIANNEIFPAVYATIATNPHMVPDQGTLAQMGAGRVVDDATIVDAIAKNGYDSGWGEAMIESEMQYPSAADSLDMLRRGLISETEFATNCERNGIPATMIRAYLDMQVQPISPADAALAVLRTNMSLGAAERVAADWGITPDDFQILIGNTGEPLGLMQLLEAYRRGFIDKATLETGIRQSRVRDEWIPTAEALRYSPMSVADAVNGVVQNHLDNATAAQYAQQNGLEPDAFPVLVENAGTPLSHTEMFSLWNRGLATDAQVVQAMRESRLKDKYIDLAMNLHVRLLEPFMLASAVQYGAVTPERAIVNAMEYGYSQSDAEALVGLGTARKLEVYKNKVIASLETMYEDMAITGDLASQTIQALGATASEADYILEAAAMKRTTKQVEQIITAVRSKYLGHHILDVDVTNLLTAAGVPGTQISYMLAQWQIEAAANVRVLTEAQVVKAAKDNLIPFTPSGAAAWLAQIPLERRPVTAPLDAQSRLVNLGYSQGDADLLLQGA